jgi:GT2 family glycosyltransferase
VSAPAVSIVIPSRHRPAKLARCLRAIAEGDLEREAYEVIVVLDGEDVAAVPEPSGLEVRWLRQARGGPAAARNRGVAAASGEILLFTDDDCEPARDWARLLVDRVTAAPDALVGGRFVNGLPENGWAEASHLVLDVVVEQTNAREAPIAFVPSANLGLRADVFRAVGGFDERFALAAAEDRDFCARCVEAGHPIVLAPEAVVRHHHGMSIAGFCRQHATYGIGAVTYQRARRQRGQGPGVAPRGLYRALLSAAVRQRQLRRVATSQAAYASGVAVGLLRSLPRSSTASRTTRNPRAS